jgi:hypothetical protein
MVLEIKRIAWRVIGLLLFLPTLGWNDLHDRAHFAETREAEVARQLEGVRVELHTLATEKEQLERELRAARKESDERARDASEAEAERERLRREKDQAVAERDQLRRELARARWSGAATRAEPLAAPLVHKAAPEHVAPRNPRPIAVPSTEGYLDERICGPRNLPPGCSKRGRTTDPSPSGPPGHSTLEP